MEARVDESSALGFFDMKWCRTCRCQWLVLVSHDQCHFLQLGARSQVKGSASGVGGWQLNWSAARAWNVGLYCFFLLYLIEFARYPCWLQLDNVYP